MSKNDAAKYRSRLQELANRLQGTVQTVEEQARQSTGGEAAGDLSNAPIHLGDIGSEVASQELGATLLENERYLQQEIGDALARIEKGTFGRCENCGQSIGHERLEAMPYARYCVACATALHAGREVNLDAGRPKSWAEGIGLRGEGPPPGAPGGPEEGPPGADTHAEGTPGGGTAVGGLAGTNVGSGDPEGSDLEGAMGSSVFDAMIEAEPQVKEPAPEVDTTAFSGPSGGAVGGTPANKRASGGGKRGRPAR